MLDIHIGNCLLWLILPALGASQTEVVKHGDTPGSILATGTLEPETVVEVGAQVAGLIRKLGDDPRDPQKTIDFGTPVEAGTILAQIDPTLYQTRAEQAKAQLRKARAALQSAEVRAAKAERDWQRIKDARSRQAVAREESDDIQCRHEVSRAEVEGAQADVGLAQAVLKEADSNLAFTAIRAPMKGIVIDRRVVVGQTVGNNASAPSLFVIASDLKKLQIWVSVPEADIRHIHDSQDVRFTVEAFSGKEFMGVVAKNQPRLNATLTNKVVSYTVVVEVDNPDGKLLPYSTAKVRFLGDQRK
jgi:HlyD family secretion protein